jgi:hypothetical protein
MRDWSYLDVNVYDWLHDGFGKKRASETFINTSIGYFGPPPLTCEGGGGEIVSTGLSKHNSGRRTSKGLHTYLFLAESELVQAGGGNTRCEYGKGSARTYLGQQRVFVFFSI